MHKSWKLYSLSPLLAGLLLLGALGGEYRPIDDFFTENDTEVHLNLSEEYQQDKSDDETLFQVQSASDVFPSIFSLEEKLCEQLFEGSDIAYFEIIDDAHGLCVKKYTENSQRRHRGDTNEHILFIQAAPNPARIALIELSRLNENFDINHDRAYQPVFLHIELEKYEPELWQRLLDHQSIYFQLDESSDQISLSAIDLSELSTYSLPDDENLLYVNYGDGSIHLQLLKGRDIQAQTPIKQTQAPQPITQSPPPSSQVQQPSTLITKTAIDHAKEAGFFPGDNCFIFDSRHEAESVAFDLGMDYDAEITAYINLSDEEKQNFTWHSYMGSRGFSTYEIKSFPQFSVILFY
ncbi:MAG: hypothetical protein Q4P72_03090 [Eubacteriales bacterium]|nr:hypothetical protein [Eubacteriales bacterium]